MRLFDKIFGKKSKADSSNQTAETVQLQKGDTFISTGDNIGFKVIRPLTDEQKEKIKTSTILLRTGQLYMHYWTDNLICTDRNDPEWQNKVMFFGKQKSHFPKNHFHLSLKLLKPDTFFLLEIHQKYCCRLARQCPGLVCQGSEKNMFVS